MNETAPRVIKIPAKPESVRQAELQRQLRVAAYCQWLSCKLRMMQMFNRSITTVDI